MPRLTRRSFLKTLLSCTGAAAAAPVLGRLLPAGAEGGRNVETASAPSWRTPPAPIASFDREAEADVCVVGGGVSGAAACRELAEEGFDVLLLEKNREADRPPRGGQLAALNAALALEKGAEEISLPEFLGEYTRRTRGEAHPGLIRTFARESGRNTDWYLDVLTGAEKDRLTLPYADVDVLEHLGGMRFWKSTLAFPEGMLSKAVRCNLERAGALGAQLLYGAEALYLTTEGGRVTGVAARDAAGTLRIRCGAVVLATGGFGANADMTGEFYGTADPVPAERRGEDGLGLRMGLWAGGVLEGGRAAAVAREAFLETDRTALPPQALWLDGHYERFRDEFSALAAYDVPGGFSRAAPDLAVFDSDFPLYRACTLPRQGAWTPGEGRAEAFRRALEEARVTGKIIRVNEEGPMLFSGATLEELADNMRLKGEEKETFLSSVRRYNDLCGLGEDEDFGRPAETLFPVREPPFYAMKASAGQERAPVTLGGLVTDGGQRVLTAAGGQIDGLYATGNACGGRFGVSYTAPVPGLALGMAVTLGRECGKTAGRDLAGGSRRKKNFL